MIIDFSLTKEDTTCAIYCCQWISGVSLHHSVSKRFHVKFFACSCTWVFSCIMSKKSVENQEKIVFLSLMSFMSFQLVVVLHMLSSPYTFL